MILVAQRGEYVGKLIVLSLDESEKIIYDKIMKIVGESDICVDKTLLKEQEPMLQIASQNGHLCHIRRPPWNLNGGQPRTH